VLDAFFVGHVPFEDRLHQAEQGGWQIFPVVAVEVQYLGELTDADSVSLLGREVWMGVQQQDIGQLDSSLLKLRPEI